MKRDAIKIPPALPCFACVTVDSCPMWQAFLNYKDCCSGNKPALTKLEQLRKSQNSQMPSVSKAEEYKAMLSEAVEDADRGLIHFD